MRSRFALPFVLVVAVPPSCGPSAQARERKRIDDMAWVSREGSACEYSRPMHCPRGASCNPPPPRPIECPAEMGDAQSARIDDDGAGGCVMLLPDCDKLACAVPISCPSRDGELATLQWTVNPGEDGRCVATPAMRTRWEAQRPDIAIDCPPSGPGVIERAAPDAPCLACATSPCDPATSATVACPR